MESNNTMSELLFRIKQYQKIYSSVWKENKPKTCNFLNCQKEMFNGELNLQTFTFL